MKKIVSPDIERLSVEEFKAAEKIPIIAVLDNVRSMHNVGAAFRTADAFRIEKIFLCGVTGQPPHREIHKTALGATETVDWQYFPHTTPAMEWLKANRYKIVLLEHTSHSIPIQEFSITPDEKIALVFGNELHGVSDDVFPYADAALEIPQAGSKHSLNVSVCMGIALWEFFKRLQPQVTAS